MGFLEANNLLSEAQCGCRRDRSSTMALAELDAHIPLRIQIKLNCTRFSLTSKTPFLAYGDILSSQHYINTAFVDS